uniref:Uncharacterized protein n=1 Tax=Arundo donax TaxID=35708 RepID=A0A0A9GAL5_ARUDO
MCNRKTCAKQCLLSVTKSTFSLL